MGRWKDKGGGNVEEVVGKWKCKEMRKIREM